MDIAEHTAPLALSLPKASHVRVPHPRFRIARRS